MWKLTNTMAVPVRGVNLQGRENAVLFFALSFLITVSCQDNSSTTYNLTETYPTVIVDNTTTSMSDGFSEFTNDTATYIWPTPSSSLLLEPTASVPQNKSNDPPIKDVGSGSGGTGETVDNSTRLQSNVSLDTNGTSISFTRSSIIYKLESVNKMETDIPSKVSLPIHTTSTYSSEGDRLMPYPTQSVLMESSSVSLGSTHLYDYMESSSQHQLLPEYQRTRTWESQIMESSESRMGFQSESLYSSSHYITPSSDVLESSSFTRELPIFYPGHSTASVSVDMFSTSVNSVSTAPTVSFTNSVLQTETLQPMKPEISTITSSEWQQSWFSSSETTSPSPSLTFVPEYSSESVTDSLFGSADQESSTSLWYSSNVSRSYPTPTLTTTPTSTVSFSWSDNRSSFSEGPVYNSSSSTIVVSPSTELYDLWTSSLEVTSTSVLYPMPITPSTQTVTETSIPEPSETPVQTWVENSTLSSVETSYSTTEQSLINPTRTESDYWEIPSTWWEYPTEIYVSSEDYYSEDTSTSHFVHEQTELLPDFGTSSTESTTTTIDMFETPASGVSEEIRPTEDSSEMVLPVSSTLQVMSASVDTLYPLPTKSIETSSQTPFVTTDSTKPKYINQKYVITFNGECQPLVSDIEKIREFQSQVKVVLLAHLQLEEDSVYMDRVDCGSVKSYVVIYNATQNYSATLDDLISSGTFLVDMKFAETNSSQIFRAYKVEGVAFFEPSTDTTGPDEQHLDDKDVVLIILACVICAVLIIIGIVICARHMYSKKYAQSFNLMDTRHSNMKMDDYTLTQFPLPRRSYGEEGVQVQSYSHYHSNGQALLPPLQHYNNHNQSSDMDSTLERSVDVGDIRMEGSKPSSFGTNTRTFEYTPNGSHFAKGDAECALPSTSLDSSSSAHDRSTENLVPGLNGSALHGSVNPIYSGDDTEGTASVSSDPPPYTDDTPVNM